MNGEELGRITARLRSRSIADATRQVFDVAVIGGGIMGASVARDAALRGYSTLLLERVDFAWATSSRSSKMLHGGIRYLEQGDLALVSEALREREIFCSIAPHLAEPVRSLFPILAGRGRPGWQVHIGLQLYDLLASIARRSTHPSIFGRAGEVSMSSGEFQALRELGLSPKRIFSYFDGSMDDTRLVIETVTDAAALGATVLNYAEVIEVGAASRGRPNASTADKIRTADSDPKWELTWRDTGPAGGTEHQSLCRHIVCAGGPWATRLNRMLGITTDIRFSRGTHLVFRRDLNLPPLTIPRRERGRYYFVHPLTSPGETHTVVGPTDVAVDDPGEDPTPTPEEIEDLLGYLRRDLPNSGLTESTLLRTFSGMRVLVPKRPGKVLEDRTESAAALRRRELVVARNGVTAIIGGKYTTARAVAQQVTDGIERLLGPRAREARGRTHPGDNRAGSARETTASRSLPGAIGWSTDAREVLHRELVGALERTRSGRPIGESDSEAPLRISADPRVLASGALMRFGMNARLLIPLLRHPSHPAPVSTPAFGAECLFAGLREHAVTAEDIVYRRLGLWRSATSLETTVRWVAESFGMPRRPDTAPRSFGEQGE